VDDPVPVPRRHIRVGLGSWGVGGFIHFVGSRTWVAGECRSSVSEELNASCQHQQHGGAPGREWPAWAPTHSDRKWPPDRPRLRTLEQSTNLCTDPCHTCWCRL